jgi:hypothetical protein
MLDAVHCASSLLSSHEVGDLVQDALADATLVQFLPHHVQHWDVSHSPCEVNAQASCVAGSSRTKTIAIPEPAAISMRPAMRYECRSSF